MARANERLGNALSQHGYEQVRTVGEGSFGKAILVKPAPDSEHEDDNQRIVKMIDISRASRKEKEDALQESQVLSSLKHPNIVRYRNNFLAEGWLCIVMDYCEGGDLSSRIKKTKAQGKSFSEDQVLWWFTQGVQALKYIHDMHILHRDLKSGNLFLSKSGNIKIGDFGIAKVLECTAACAQTQVGTPYYLCPEICKGRPYSWGSDIWAMGCILHELCALRVPFDGHDLKSLIQNITKAPTPQLPPKYSRSVQDLLNKLLSRNSAARPYADDILEIPVIRDVVKKIRIEERESDRRHSVASSEAAPEKPRSEAAPESDAAGSCLPSDKPSGKYGDAAGKYTKREKVEYLSSTHMEWLPATILDVDAKGQILMDVKPNTWITLDVQAEKVRPRQNSSAPESKAAKRPSTAAVAPRSAAARPMSAREAGPAAKMQAPAAPPPRRRSSLGQPPNSARGAPNSARGYGVRDRRPSSACHEVNVGAKHARMKPGGNVALLGA